jgi:hypothetical protein
LVEDQINEINEPVKQSTNIKNNSNLSTTTKLPTKMFRFKRIKSLNDLIDQFKRSETESIDYGTILYVGKKEEKKLK